MMLTLRALCLVAFVLLMSAGPNDCQPCEDPSQLICP